MRSHRLFQSIRWLALAYVAQKLATLVSLAFLARYMGDAEFGGFAIALAIPAGLEAITDLGLAWALVRDGAGRPQLARALAVAALPAKVALGASTIALTFAAATVLSLPAEIVDAAVLLAVARALDSLTYLGRALFQAHERMEFDAAAQSLDAVVRLALTVYAVAGGFGLTGLAKAYVVAAAIVLAGTGTIALRRFVRPMRPQWDLLRGLIIAGFPLALVWLLDGLMVRVGLVILGERLGREAAGNVAAAVRLIEPLLGFAALASTALFPLTARHIVEDKATLPWLFHASVKMAVIGALAAAVVLAGSGSVIVHLVFGEGFAEAAALIRQLAPSLVPLFVTVLLIPLLLALRRHGPLLLALACGVVVNSVLVLATAPLAGPAAAAIGLFVGQAAVIAVTIGGVPELRRYGVPAALRVSWLAAPAAAALTLGASIGDVPATGLALLVLLVGVRTFAVIAPREIAYLEGIGPRVGRLSRFFLAPLR